MKWTIALLTGFTGLLLLCSQGHAQRPGNIALTGTVLDSSNAEPLAYATLSLLTDQDSVRGGTLTNDKGTFELKGLQPGNYFLELDFIGYRKKRIGPFTLYAAEAQKNLGRISLSPANYQLEDVQITDRADLMLNNIDRKTYNVERNLMAEGGAATDVLKTIPSVEVDIDGNLSLRGSGNVTVLIDGKPSALTGAGRTAILQQIPASSIKSIEVITNPSARFDPDGMSGIINIVTKKSKSPGLNGNLSVGVGTNDKYNSSLSLGFRNKRMNAYGTYSFRLEDRWLRFSSSSNTPLDTISPLLVSDGKGTNERLDQVARGGVDFYLGERTTLGIAGGWAGRRDRGLELNQFEEFTPGDVLYARYWRPNHEAESSSTVDGELNLQQRFKKEQRQLDVRVAWSQGTNTDDNSFRTIHFLEEGGDTLMPDDYQNNTQTDRIQLGTAQADYSHRINENNALETGAKVTSRDIRNTFFSESLNHSLEEFVSDTLLNNDFLYRERIFAAYGIFNHSFSEKLTAQVGLRAEEALTRSQLVGQDAYTNNYFKLFPNAYLSYVPTRTKEFRLNYSRRINRPITEQLNPFTDYTNAKRLRVGNPQLLPELIDAFELSFNRKFDWGSLNSTAYFRYITNGHTRFFEPIRPGSDTLLMTTRNLVNGQSYGLELIAQTRPAKWMELMVSGNFFRTQMNATNLETDLTVNNLGMTSNLNSTIYFSKNTQFQLTANYSTPRLGPQGTFAAVFSTDVAFRQNLLKGKGSVNLRLSDVFNTRRFRIIADTELVSGDNYRKRESRTGYITFNYRFGSGETTPKRKRQEERSGGGEFDF
jgi:iron complex outermembrane recepter protein